MPHFNNCLGYGLCKFEENNGFRIRPQTIRLDSYIQQFSELKLVKVIIDSFCLI